MKKLIGLFAVITIALMTVACKQSETPPAPPIIKIVAETPVFNENLSNSTYTAGETATALDGSATVTDGGTISYEWYKNSSNSTSGGEIISNATNATFIPPTNNAGTLYYYVVATNTITDNGDGGQKTASKTSNIIKIIVNNIVSISTPSFDADLISATYTVGETAMALDGNATVLEGRPISYQWYKNSLNSTTGGELITGATSATYTPPTNNVGTFYYYVIASNTTAPDESIGQTTASTFSNVVQIVITDAIYTVTFIMEGGSLSYNRPSSIQVSSGESISLPTSNKDDWAFNGWKTGDDIYYSETNFVVNSNITFTAQWLPYTLFNEGTGIEKYNGTNTSVIIPSTIDGKDIVWIGNNSFRDKINITNIEIPDTVTRISAEAFKGCSELTSIIIASNVQSVGSDAFKDCDKLTIYANIASKIGYDGLWDSGRSVHVTIPDTETTINDYAFSFPTGGSNGTLKSVSIPEGVTSIGKSAFSNCVGLTSVAIPKGVTSIGDKAFYYTAIENINMPDSLTSIGQDAFYCCPLTSITIPNNVTLIEDRTFNRCNSLKTVVFNQNITSIGNNAFSGCNQLESITIPNKVTSIGDSAFNSCKNLTSVTIEEGLVSIGNSAFFGCENLTNITIPEGITSIGNDAFKSCFKLEEVNIPSTIISIGNSAFSFCKDLRTVTVGAITPPSLGSSAFANTPTYGLSIYVPAESKNTYTIYWMDYSTKIKSIAEKPQV